MEDSQLTRQIEAILFFKNEPVSLKELSDLLQISREEVQNALTNLKAVLQSRGVVLVHTDDEATLKTAPDMSELIEGLRRQELSGDLGRAALETLSLVLYRGPISRADIDYIRGVHSQFILRRLTIRGLVEKKENPKNKQSYLYTPSIKLLSHLGISNLHELPEYEKVQVSLSELSEEEKVPAHSYTDTERERDEEDL